MSEPLPSRQRRIEAPEANEIPPTRRREFPAEADPASFPVEPRALIQRLSQEVAALRRALEQSHHRIATLEAEVSEDPLSGLLNERAFSREIERALQFQGRYRTVTSVALVNFEGLTAIGQRLGRTVANRLLRIIGDHIRASIRSCDVGARIGEEQFGIVLWNAAPADCDQRLSALKTAIAGLDLAFLGPDVAIGFDVAVTGIEPGETPEAIIARADQAFAA
ncbi:GGDEF domain-containing protein [Kaistia dalseonensis]|uniref:diguanylate cyclase n=1 Tax=Kaistia dalseonensis TaxID=410840 RepID=A0ABU0HDE1_9HYPH|nr:GGDEF domain-containing protein [Kaistia dalseonensis]MCX5496888.1 GGDEF domain-containing protein [Kaistia dalseonensis]MDQ0439514.1 diguanylate cyclase (GGDEF)-like protein [Kaistia dalseonensis]